MLQSNSLLPFPCPFLPLQGSAVAADQATAALFLYLSPSFRLDDGALAEALTEAAAMLAWLEGGAKGPQARLGGGGWAGGAAVE